MVRTRQAGSIFIPGVLPSRLPYFFATMTPLKKGIFHRKDAKSAKIF
jgi:hypothetical protein